MEMDLSEFFTMFFEECIELLEDVEKTLLNIDVATFSDDEINLIFRGMHSIKGGSATFGFSDITEFTHILETYLDNVRNRTLLLSMEAVDLLLKSVDCIRGLIETRKGNGQQDLSIIEHIKHQFEQYNQITDDKEVKEDLLQPIKDIENKNRELRWHIYFKPHPAMMQKSNDPLRIINELYNTGNCIVIANTEEVPLWHDIHFEECYTSWDIYVSSDKSEDEIKGDIFDWVLGDCELIFKELSFDIKTQDEFREYILTLADEREKISASVNNTELQPSIEANSPEIETPTLQDEPKNSKIENPVSTTPTGQNLKTPTVAKESPSIRVSTEKVDEIINIVGELVITQAILRQVINGNEELVQDPKLKECLSQFSQNIRELQERAMVMRMLPISNVFNRLPRMVRDIAQKIGKKIELKIYGENTELDKTVMEKIGDPLVHLVRNSIDHGIEDPEVRLERNKPEVGVLELKAYHQGSAIIVDIIDDGNGLNTDKIRQKALEKGLINEDHPLTNDEIYDLIFLPGFSTADKVTDISGRGVGMDVVKKNLQAVGGSISVYSTPGAGSRFSIKLPLTLSIIDGQILTVSNQTFIIPINSIVEIIQIRCKQVSKVAEEHEVYFLRSKYIPMVHLTQAFNLSCDNADLEGKFLVIVEVNNAQYGIVIDELLGQQQIVIKSIEQNFQYVEGIAGATVLGDGTVALIVDITGLVQLSGKKKQSLYQERFGNTLLA